MPPDLYRGEGVPFELYRGDEYNPLRWNADVLEDAPCRVDR